MLGRVQFLTVEKPWHFTTEHGVDPLTLGELRLIGNRPFLQPTTHTGDVDEEG